MIEFLAPFLGFMSFWSYPIVILVLPFLAIYICNKMSPSEEEIQKYHDQRTYEAVERHKKTLKESDENVHRYPEDW